MKSLVILFIVTSHAMMGNTGEKTGLWLEELTTPYYALQEAGYSVEFATVKGGIVPIDPRSLEGDEHPQSVVQYLNDTALQTTLKHTIAAEKIDMEKYAAVFFPGGHGTVWDFPNNETLANIITTALASDKPVAAVCHGPAVFVGVENPDGTPLVAGKKIAAFTNSEEYAVGLSEVVPFMLETKLTELGAEIVKTDNFKSNAVIDGNLITGQNPASSLAVANLMIEALQTQHAQITPAAE